MFYFNFFKKLIVFIGILFSFTYSAAGTYDDFFNAVKLDDAQEVQRLLVRGFDPNTLDAQGRPGLVLALSIPSIKVAEVLIRNPLTRVELRNDKDESPLMLAALRGQLGLVELLIWRDADVNKTGWTPLHYAASGGHAHIAQLLLDHSAYIDAESPNGTTPLMMAAMYGTPEVVKLLLVEGADIDHKNLLGMTALDFAKQAKRPDAITLLSTRLSVPPVPKSTDLTGR
jgi:uncharacterized protein